MASKCSPFMYGVAGLALVTLIFHLIGFITPGWLVMKRTVTEPPRHIGAHFIENDLFSSGQLHKLRGEEAEIRKRRSSSSDSADQHEPGHHGSHPPPHGDSGHHGSHQPPHGGGSRPPHHRPPHGRPEHHGERPGHHRPHESSESMDADSSMSSKPEHHPDEKPEFDKQMMGEKESIIDWMRMKKDEMQGAEIQTNYGLWYSKVCVSPAKTSKMVPKHINDMDEKDEMHEMHEKVEKVEKHEKDKKDKKDDHSQVHCKKISTHTALYYSYIYESRDTLKKNERTIGTKKFAFACLTEHQVEACIGLALIVIGLVTTVLGYRDLQKYKCLVYASIVCLVLAAFVTTVPVSRFAHYSVHKHNERFPVHVQVPYSVISSGLSAFLALCTALISVAVLFLHARKNKGGNWSQFENEKEQASEKKNVNLVFYNDQLPAKPGLYDVCDFSDIKPVEEQTMDLAQPKEAVI